MNLSQLTAETAPELLQELQATIARINTVHNREHQADGTHKIPEWKSIVPGTDIGPSNFTGPGGQTWTVANTNIETLEAAKSGNSMTVAFRIVGTTVGGTPQPYVSMPIPFGLTAAKAMMNMIYLTDAATRVDGFAAVAANGTTINFYRADLANYTGGTTAVDGQLSFRTTT